MQLRFLYFLTLKMQNENKPQALFPLNDAHKFRLNFPTSFDNSWYIFSQHQHYRSKLWHFFPLITIIMLPTVHVSCVQKMHPCHTAWCGSHVKTQQGALKFCAGKSRPPDFECVSLLQIWGPQVWNRDMGHWVQKSHGWGFKILFISLCMYK